MKLYRHHFKKSDSWMWMYWVRHDGFGFCPYLIVNKIDKGIYFYFLFTWWRFEWYWASSAKNKK